MDANTRYAIDDKQVSHNDFDDEVVVIHFETGNYYSLRTAAATLWKCLSQGPASTTRLLAAFTSPPPTAADEIGQFLADLKTRGVLIETSEEESNVPLAVTPQVFAKPEMEAFEDLQALLVADVIHDTYEQGWPHVADDAA